MSSTSFSFIEASEVETTTTTTWSTISAPESIPQVLRVRDSRDDSDSDLYAALTASFGPSDQWRSTSLPDSEATPSEASDEEQRSLLVNPPSTDAQSMPDDDTPCWMDVKFTKHTAQPTDDAVAPQSFSVFSINIRYYADLRQGPFDLSSGLKKIRSYRTFRGDICGARIVVETSIPGQATAGGPRHPLHEICFELRKFKGLCILIYDMKEMPPILHIPLGPKIDIQVLGLLQRSEVADSNDSRARDWAIDIAKKYLNLKDMYIHFPRDSDTARYLFAKHKRISCTPVSYDSKTPSKDSEDILQAGLIRLFNCDFITSMIDA